MVARNHSFEEVEVPFLRPGTPALEERSLPVHPTHSPWKIVFIIASMIFLLAFGGTLMAIPGVRIYEDILCHEYYDKLEGYHDVTLSGKIDEKLCKGEEVQSRLNSMLGGLAVLNSIPGLLMAMPYGLLADRIGRKKVFALSATGIILSGISGLTVMWFSNILPIHLVWVTPIFIFIGGGEATMSTVFFSIGSDISTEANRANVFLFGASGALLAQLIAPSIASILMMRSPWIPILLGFGLVISGCIIFMLVVPETLHLHISKTSTLEPDLEPEIELTNGVKASLLTDLRSKFWENIKNVRAATTILHSPPILLLLMTFIITPFGNQSGGIALRYISKQYGWTLAEAGFLLSVNALVNIVLLVIIIPTLSYYITERMHYSSKAKDLYLAQASAVLQLLAALLLVLSSSVGATISGLAIWSLGSGFSSLVRSLITTLVDKEHVGRLNAAIGVVETAGTLTAAPTLAALYSLGLHLKGAWVTLPFDALFLISFVGGLGVWCFGFLDKEKPILEHGDIMYGDEHPYSDDAVSLETEGLENSLLG
ncbi:hypothetical protein B7463_g7814, partial [Scytalidium lignicola]